MKKRKILAILLSIAMICSSLPAYAASGNVSSESSLNMTSQSASSYEVPEAAQNDESSFQPESDASSEEAINNENNSQAESDTSSEEIVNNEDNSQAESDISSEEIVNNEDNSQAESDASSEEAVESENNSQTEDNNNILQQNVANSQDEPTEQSVYYLNGGDADIYYSDGNYYITRNGATYSSTYAPIISSYGEISNQVHLHDFTPDEANPAPYVIIRDLNIFNDSTAIEIDGIVNLRVENNCSLRTTSTTAAAIDVDENAELTISGSGSLYVSSSGNGAVIGGAGNGEMAPVCGDIFITENVQVTAENTGNGAGIGGGFGPDGGGSVGRIEIVDYASVTAVSNGPSPAIGGGGNDSAIATEEFEGGCVQCICIEDNANVTAIANDERAAAIGVGQYIKYTKNIEYYWEYVDGLFPRWVKKSHVWIAYDQHTNIYIKDAVHVTAVGGYTGIGRCRLDYDDGEMANEVDTFEHAENRSDSQIHLENTATVKSYALYSDIPINAQCCTETIPSTGERNGKHYAVMGKFMDCSISEQPVSVEIVNVDGSFESEFTMPQYTKSFVITVPTDGQYCLSTESVGNQAQSILESVDYHNFTFNSREMIRGGYNDAAYVAWIQPSIDLDLSQGSITISKNTNKATADWHGKNGIIEVEQNGQKYLTDYGRDNIKIIQSSPRDTGNNIAIKGSVDAAQPIVFEDIIITCEQPIIVEDGADVNFILHNHNSLSATNCQQSTDYPAIEVPNGATVTLSGDGSLEATAGGYAAAIGTKGYYRDGLDHGDGDKSSGTIQIDGDLNVKAHSAYGAGIGGGAISGSTCEQHAFDNGTVIIKGNAVVEALGSTKGSYSAGIGGGGCYTSTCAAVGGDGGDVQILDNAHVTAACKGSLGAGIGSGGGCGKTADGFGGDGESFKAEGNAVVNATGGQYGPGIGGGGAQQETCCGTHPGDSGSCSVLGYSYVTVQSGGNANDFGIGGHTGGWANYNGSYTEPVIDPTATLQGTGLMQPSINMDLSQGSITISKTYGEIAVEQSDIKLLTLSGNDNITITQSSSEATGNNITIQGSVDGAQPDSAQPIILENLNISCEQPIVVEDGANVNLIFHNHNSLTATNCQQSTDYPAIEVPNGATVTLSGDGSLEATANGYAAAIGTKGYYRDGKDHSDGDKSSGTIQIDGNLNVKAHSAYGAGIGGGAISGSTCEQDAFDNGTVIIKGNAVVEALGSTEGSYSAGIGGGGCYTSTCAADGGDGGDVQISDNAHVTAACKGSLGAGIGGGGGCGKTADGFGGDGESFKAEGNAVVNATGGQYGPGIGGGGAQQETTCGTFPGDSGSCSVLGYSNVTVQSGGNANGFGIGGHTGGYRNYNGSYTEPVIDQTATLQGTDLLQPSINMDLSQGSITISQTYSEITVEQNDIELLTLSGKDNITITQSSPEATGNNITIQGSVKGAQPDSVQPIILENLNISCEQPIVVEDGADINLIFHNNNSLTATNCEQSTDYPAIEVPNGATVTLSGDGSLEATANGYAAAIGTKGYYRDGKDHSDGDKSSGTIQIDGDLNVKAHSAYGAGIGGGSINGSSCEQHAFDNGTVIIKGNAVVEALGSTEGSYSAGIGGGGCYTSTCAAVGGDGGDVQISDNAHVTAVCKGSLGAGIGGGGGCGKTADGFGGDGESFKAEGNAVIVATGAKYGPGIGGGGAQQKTCCGTHPGNSGSCSVLGNSNVTAQHGGSAGNFGIGGHTGGWANYNGSYTDPVVDPTATFIY